MRYIIAVITALLLTACINGLPTPKEYTEYDDINDTDSNITSIKNADIYDYFIDGTYVLKEGVYTNGGIVKKVTHAYMVIEKLSDEDFGYYYATQAEKYPANNDFGIYNYNDDERKFYKKIVLDEKSTKTELRENVELIKTDDGVRLTSKTNGAKIIKWERVPNGESVTTDPALADAIRDAKESYTLIYKNRFEQLEEKSFFDFFSF